MTATNRWSETGIVRKNSLLRAKLTLATKATGSTAEAAVGDYYEFNCKSKNLPAPSDAPTWSDVTDNPEEPTGFAYAGKSDQINAIELVTRTPIPLVYDDLLAHKTAGDVFTLTFVYDDPHETSVYTMSIANCQIIDVSPAAGENNAGSETTIRILPEGGTAANMPTVTATARGSGAGT